MWTWPKALKDSFGVDDDGELVHTVVFDCPGMSKAEIYLEARTTGLPISLMAAVLTYNWPTRTSPASLPGRLSGAAVSNTVWLKFSADL